MFFFFFFLGGVTRLCHYLSCTTLDLISSDAEGRERVGPPVFYSLHLKKSVREFKSSCNAKQRKCEVKIIQFDEANHVIRRELRACMNRWCVQSRDGWFVSKTC